MQSSPAGQGYNGHQSVYPGPDVQDMDEGDHENEVSYGEEEDRSPGHSTVDELDEDDGGDDDGGDDDSEQTEQNEADDDTKPLKRKRNLPCTKCGRLYSSENSLRNHIRIKHSFQATTRARASSTDGCVPIRAKNSTPTMVTPVLGGTPISGTPTPPHIVSMQAMPTSMDISGGHPLMNAGSSQELATIPIPNMGYAPVAPTMMSSVAQVWPSISQGCRAAPGKREIAC